MIYQSTNAETWWQLLESTLTLCSVQWYDLLLTQWIVCVLCDWPVWLPWFLILKVIKCSLKCMIAVCNTFEFHHIYFNCWTNCGHCLYIKDYHSNSITNWEFSYVKLINEIEVFQLFLLLLLLFTDWLSTETKE